MNTNALHLDRFDLPNASASTRSTPLTPSLGAIDITADRRPSFGRLVRIELRKLTDTRSGRVQIGAMVGIGLVINVIMLVLTATGAVSDLTFIAYAGASQFGLLFLLPSVVILLITSEWRQRAAMTTFTLVPNRGRVIGAKLAAALAATLTAFVVTLGFAVLANLISGAIGDGQTVWGDDFWWIPRDALTFVYLAAMAAAFALLLLNSAGSLVSYYLVAFALPPVMMGLYALGWIGEIVSWVNPTNYLLPLFDASDGSNWAHAAVSAVIWVVIPMAIGIRRVLSTEIK